MRPEIQRVLARARRVSAHLRAALTPAPVSRVSMWSRPDHLTMLQAMVPDDGSSLSLLDLGCGDATFTRQLPSARQTYVDLERRPGTPEPFVQADAIEFLKDHGDGHDMIFCLDTIEHMHRPVGDELLALITARARRLAVFFTPLGPMYINLEHPLGHRTGWWPHEFAAAGYHTWAFPRFHDPWIDGYLWGAFYAWKWTRSEPGATARLGKLTSAFGLANSAAALQDPAVFEGMNDSQAQHWRAHRQLYAEQLFPSGPRPG